MSDSIFPSHHIISSSSTNGPPPDCQPYFGLAGLWWLKFGLSIIPIIPKTKKPARSWDPWLERLSPCQIKKHWRENPTHELGYIVGDDLIVFDADTPESIKSLETIEKSQDVYPLLVSETRRGQHHHFRLKPGTFVHSDSHCSVSHPERIDIKTGRALILLPPSFDKSLKICDITNAASLTEVDQAFVDSVYLMNGRNVPRPPEPTFRRKSGLESLDKSMHKLTALIEEMNPDCAYDEWIRVLAVIYHQTGGSDEGFALADSWSSLGTKYKGRRDVMKKWLSFDINHPNPCTIGTLCWMIDEAGGDSYEILAALEPDFEKIKADGEDL